MVASLHGLPDAPVRGAVTSYPTEVFVVASLHGLPDAPVRDAILRAIAKS